MENRKVVILCSILVCSVIVPVFAYEYIWKTEPKYINNGVILTTPHANVSLGIYWDSACTDPVTTFDFGEMWHPNQRIRLVKHMYIRNEGNVTLKVYWNSTLNSMTTEITDDFFINGTALSVGEKPRWGYAIDIEPYSTVGTYNWTVSVWGEYTY